MEKKKRAFDRILENVKPENKAFVDFLLSFAEQVRHTLNHHPEIKTQKDLALRLNKEESEVSRWLSGLHNLTIDSITKIGAALGEELIMTDQRAREKYGKVSETIIFMTTAKGKTRDADQSTLSFDSVTVGKQPYETYLV